MPFFSIILPTYNRAHMLPRAIDSVLAQTFRDWELIIMDDGSTDDTKKVITKYTDRRIQYHRQENKERSAARNNGIARSVGRYICFLDSDDSYLPSHLSAFYNELEKLGFPSCFLFCDVYSDTHAGPEYNPYLNRRNYNPLERLFNSMICILQVCIERSVLMKHKFNEYLNLGEDMELWSRIVVEYPMLYVNSKTVIIGEHLQRSIYLQEQRYKQNAELALKIFRKAPENMKVRAGVRLRFLGHCHYGQAKEYIMAHRYARAFFHTLAAFLYDPSRMLKHKLLLMAALLFHRKKAREMIPANP